MQPFLKPWAFLFRHRKLLFSSLSRISTDLQVHQHSDSTSSLLLTPSEWLCFLAMQSPNNSSAYPPTNTVVFQECCHLKILGVNKHENKKTCCSSRGTHTHTPSQSSKKDFRPLRGACIQDQPALILTAKLFIFQSVPVTFPLSLVQARRWRRSRKKLGDLFSTASSLLKKEHDPLSSQSLHRVCTGHYGPIAWLFIMCFLVPCTLPEYQKLVVSAD